MKINFVPTIRLAFIFLLGIIPLFLGGPWADSFLIFLVYNLVLLTLSIIDYFFASSCKVEVVRTIKNIFSLGVENRVEISVLNKSPFSLILHMKDDYPSRFKSSSGRVFNLHLLPHSREEVTYNLIPYHRGKYSFGKIYLRSYSFLRLVGRAFVVDKEQEVKVYPNVENIGKYQLMAMKGHLHTVGIKPARIMGRGMDFESLRDYVPDDEYRIINWKASARRGKFIVNQYDEEKSQNVLLMLDAGRMMTGCIGEMSKLDYAINAVFMLSYVCALKGDRVGLLVFASDIKSYLPPSRGKKQIQIILEILFDLQPELVEPDYSAAFRFLGTKIRKRTLVFLFTDLMDQNSSSELVKYFPTLFPSHLPFCVAISDPEIEEISSRDCKDSREVYQQAVAKQVLLERKYALGILEKMGVYTLDALPGEISVRVINEYLKIKSMARL